jgi:hypothetical protein
LKEELHRALLRFRDNRGTGIGIFQELERDYGIPDLLVNFRGADKEGRMTSTDAQRNLG